MDRRKMDFAIRWLANHNRMGSLTLNLLGDTDIYLAGNVDIYRGLEPSSGNVMGESSDPIRAGVLGGEKEIRGADRVLPTLDPVVPNLEHVNFGGVVGSDLQMDGRIEVIAGLRHADGDRRIGIAGIASLGGRPLVKNKRNTKHQEKRQAVRH